MNIIIKKGKIVEIVPNKYNIKDCIFKDCEGLDILFNLKKRDNYEWT